MEEKKKNAEPILPPDIQRLIDEIEGASAEEPQPVRRTAGRADEPREEYGSNYARSSPYRRYCRVPGCFRRSGGRYGRLY